MQMYGTYLFENDKIQLSNRKVKQFFNNKPEYLIYYPDTDMRRFINYSEVTLVRLEDQFVFFDCNINNKKVTYKLFLSEDDPCEMILEEGVRRKKQVAIVSFKTDIDAKIARNDIYMSYYEKNPLLKEKMPDNLPVDIQNLINDFFVCIQESISNIFVSKDNLSTYYLHNIKVEADRKYGKVFNALKDLGKRYNTLPSIPNTFLVTDINNYIVELKKHVEFIEKHPYLLTTINIAIDYITELMSGIEENVIDILREKYKESPLDDMITYIRNSEIITGDICHSYDQYINELDKLTELSHKF